MSKISSDASKIIDDYIYNLPKFSNEICSIIRECILEANSNAIEDWKWKIPCFSGLKLICGFAAFKKHVSLTFFNGSQMSDNYNLFTEDCSAQKNRTIKFSSATEINKVILIEYFKESFIIDELGLKKKPSKKEIIIPKLLQDALDKNVLAKENFNKLAYTYRKEYTEHITKAKRETTKLNRLEKIIFNLEKNLKMHEKYNC